MKTALFLSTFLLGISLHASITGTSGAGAIVAVPAAPDLQPVAPQNAIAVEELPEALQASLTSGAAVDYAAVRASIPDFNDSQPPSSVVAAQANSSDATLHLDPNPQQTFSSSGTTAAVPEPSTYALISGLLAAGALAVRKLRRTKRS